MPEKNINTLPGDKKLTLATFNNNFLMKRHRKPIFYAQLRGSNVDVIKYVKSSMEISFEIIG